MRPLILMLAVLTALASAAEAQSYSGDFILGGANYSQNDAIFRVDRQFNLTTIATGITSNSTTHYVWEVIMAEDNHHFYALSAHYGAVNKIVKVDPGGLIIATVFTGTTTLLKNAVNMHLDQNGNIVVFDCGGSSTGPSTLYEIDPVTGVLTTIGTMPKGASLYGSGAIDIDSGDYLTWAGDTVFRVDRITRAVTTPVVASASVARMGFEQDPLSGKAYAGTCCSNTVWELDLPNSRSTLLVGPMSFYGVYGLRFDRRVNAKLNRFYVAYGGFSSTTLQNGIALIDTTGVVTPVTTWQCGKGQPMPYSLEIEGSREVQAQLFTAPNDRRILLSFPGLGGKSYVSGVSISGLRPGIPLGDGRKINLVPDSILTASLNGALDFLIPNRAGSLDPSGNATMGLSLNLLGRAVKGLTIWVQVVVLDPPAPLGIAVVAEPYPIKLE